MYDEKLTAALAGLGALPFVGCAAMIALGYDTLPGLGATDFVLSSYGLAIASFMAGTLWGLYLKSPGELPLNLFLASNALLLMAWFGLLILPTATFFAALMLVFVLLWYLDRLLHDAGTTTAAYFRMRTVVTAVVVASLGLALTQS